MALEAINQEWTCFRMKLPSFVKRVRSILLGLVFWAMAGRAVLGSNPPQVLVLNSYHHGLGWSDGIVRGLQSALNDVELIVEYMDAKRHPEDVVEGLLHDLYRAKYREARFPAIVATDDDAFRFLLRYRDELFPGAPVVFCGVNDFRPELLEGRPLFTGVVETTSRLETMQLMARLHPGIRTIYIVSDRTSTGRVAREQVEEIAAREQIPVRIEFLDTGQGLDVSQLMERLRSLPPDSGVYYMDFFRDRLDRFVSYEDVFPLLSAACPVPIYVHSEVYIGLGAVGGKVNNGEFDGEAAGRMVRKILEGTPVDEIPVERQGPTRYVFDDSQLIRWGIAPSRLPEGSRVLNRPDNFYRTHRSLLVQGAALVIVQSLIIVWLLINIGQRRRAQKALELNEDKLKRAQKVAGMGFWETQFDSGHLTWSEEVYRMFGLRPEEFDNTRESFYRRVHPEDRERVRDLFERAARGEAEYSLDHRIVLPGEGVCHVHEQAELLKDASGQPVGMLGIVLNISRRKQAEEEREALRQLSQELTLPVTLREVGRVVARTSRRLFRHDAFHFSYFDRTRRVQRGLYSEDTFDDGGEPAEVPAVDIPLEETGLRHLFEGRSHLIDRREELARDLEPFGNESRRSESLMFVPVLWGGQAVGDISVQSYAPGRYSQRDLELLEALAAHCSGALQRVWAEEDRKRMEGQILQAQKLESLGILAGGIAHDFNNLLMGILGNAELARDEIPSSSPAGYHLQEIETASKRAAELCRQMLAYSGKGKFVIEKIDLGNLVREMAHLMEVSISKKIVLKYRFAENLPIFEGDASQIRQIVMNLIVNASEAIGDRSGVIAVSTGAMAAKAGELEAFQLGDPLKPGFYVYLEVSDTGCGMDSATLTRVFDPFFTTKFTGRGLGLAAVQGIVRGHRGGIRIVSEPSRGTSFRIVFPCSDAEDSGREEDRFSSPSWRGRGTVLLADDEETVRAVGQIMLQKAGFEVIIASNGREAVEALRRSPDGFCCIILDLTMPVMSGLEALSAIREIASSIPVLISSGYEEQELGNRMETGDIAGFLQKPYTSDLLIGKLKAVLEGQ